MPGPIVPRPAPLPRASDLVLPLCAMTSIAVAVRLTVSSLVSCLGDGAAEVDGSESGEDECLQAGDQHDLEDEEGDGDRDGDHAERRHAEEHDHAAGHEEDEQVAGEQVREESDGQRDDPDEVRDHLDDEEERLERTRRAGGDERADVAAEAPRPDALDVVAEPHDEGEDERHGDVRRRRVQGERRDLEAEEPCRRLGGRRKRYVADQVREEDEEEQRPDEREPLARVLLRHVPAHDVVVREVVDGLYGGLDVVRPLLHLAGDVDHRDRRRRGREEEVGDGLVGEGVEPADLEVHPRVELELVLRLVLVVPPCRAERGVERDRHRKPGSQAERDLLAGREVLQPRLHGLAFGGGVSNGRIAMVMVSCSVKTRRKRTAAARPASESLMPTATMMPATTQPRTIMLPARRPTRVRTSSAAVALRTASSLIRRWTAQAPAPVTQPRIGKPAITKSTRATARAITSTFLRTRTEVGVSGAAAISEFPSACVDKSRSHPESDPYPEDGRWERRIQADFC